MMRLLWLEAGGQLAESSDPAVVTARVREPETCFWLDIEAPDEDDAAFLGGALGFHPLAIEDALGPRHHPKLDDFGGYLFLVVHGVLNEAGPEFQTFTASAFLGRHYLVTIHAGAVASIEETRNFLQKNPEALGRGADYVLYQVLDRLVDCFLPVVDDFDELIAELEDEIFASPTPRTLERIFELKRALMRLKRVTTHQREVLARLARDPAGFISDVERLWYRDVYDHLVRVADLAESYRDLVTSCLDAYLSQTSNRLNEVMKFLTVISTILLPMNLIAGIYGMNFRHMPELEQWWGYPATLVLMAGIGVSLYAYFRAKGWIAAPSLRRQGRARRRRASGRRAERASAEAAAARSRVEATTTSPG